LTRRESGGIRYLFIYSFEKSGMEKLYYTLPEATAYLKTDSVNLGERGILAMAYRWPEAADTLNSNIVIESRTKPGYVPARFSYLRPTDFQRVVNAHRTLDKVHLLHVFGTMEDSLNADEIIRHREGAIKLLKGLVKSGVHYSPTLAGLDDIYVTADAIEAYEAGASNTSVAHQCSDTSTKPGITKGQVINAFNGVYQDRDWWTKALGKNIPVWLKSCRVTQGRPGNNKISATWNPVFIAVALIDQSVLPTNIDIAFARLPDWRDEWLEVSANDR
jgi:hypothetical protein